MSMQRKRICREVLSQVCVDCRLRILLCLACVGSFVLLDLVCLVFLPCLALPCLPCFLGLCCFALSCLAWLDLLARSFAALTCSPTYSPTHSLNHSITHSCNAMQCNAMQCDAMRCNAMQWNGMRCLMQYGAAVAGLRELFDYLDRDGTGFLSKEDFAKNERLREFWVRACVFLCVRSCLGAFVLGCFRAWVLSCLSAFLRKCFRA